MKIGPNDTVHAIRELLREVVAPCVNSERATFALRQIMAVLGRTDWENSSFALLRENENLAALATDVRAIVQTDPSAAFAAAMAQWDVLASESNFPISWAEANAQNEALRTAAAETMASLQDTTVGRSVRNEVIASLLKLYRDGSS